MASRTLFSAWRSAGWLRQSQKRQIRSVVEIARAVAIEQVLALTLLEADVVTDGLENPYELLIQVARMHGTALRLALHKDLGNV